MTIHAEQVGRDLHITLEGVEQPFVVRPLPGRAGLQVTSMFLGVSGGLGSTEQLAEMMIMCVDGAVYDAETDTWSPVPEEQRTNYTRLGFELSQKEADDVLYPAFFWQSVLGIDGVNAYLEAGGGLPGALKATGALAVRLGRLPRPTSPSSESESPTNGVSTPSTPSPSGGGSNAKKPQDRLPKKGKKRKG